MLAALRSAEWSHFRDYVSSTFFDVLPATDLASVVAGLSRNTTRKRAFEALRGELARAWQSESPSVRPVRSLNTPSLAVTAPFEDEVRNRVGDAVLAMFFRIVLNGGDVILDLRPARLGWDGGGLQWAPSRLWSSWDDDFSRHVSGLYRGFYGDDDALFDRSLAGLGLTSARATLRTHFGGDDQSAVAFELQTFHSTFHEVFVSCRDGGASLHRGFVSLGLLLACLYETLELLGGTFDVRAAYEQVAAQ